MQNTVRDLLSVLLMPSPVEQALQCIQMETTLHWSIDLLLINLLAFLLMLGCSLVLAVLRSPAWRLQHWHASRNRTASPYQDSQSDAAE